MLKKFICGSEKYQLGGPRMDTIILPISFSNLPEKIEVEGYSLTRKSSFHISLVCTGKIIEKYKITIPDFLDKVVADFCEFVKENPIELLNWENEFKFVSEKERRAVITMCDISNLNKFFDHINRKYTLSLEYPPTHATIYTLQPDIGIFITDSSDIENLTKPIPSPNLILSKI